jgi:hypothetical protein
MFVIFGPKRHRDTINPFSIIQHMKSSRKKLPEGSLRRSTQWTSEPSADPNETSTHLHAIPSKLGGGGELNLFIYVSLTVHLVVTITLANDQLDAQIFNKIITILYMYMFRAISCSSSGGQIVLIQHLVSSLSVSDHPLHRLRQNVVPSKPVKNNLCRTTICDWTYVFNFYVSLTVHLSINLANDQLDAQFLIQLLQSSTCTCFEQYLAHPQEVKLYYYNILYRHCQ